MTRRCLPDSASKRGSAGFGSIRPGRPSRARRCSSCPTMNSALAPTPCSSPLPSPFASSFHCEHDNPGAVMASSASSSSDWSEVPQAVILILTLLRRSRAECEHSGETVNYKCHSMALGLYTRYAPELATHGRYDVMPPARLQSRRLTHFNDPPSSLSSSAQG